jgi:hypothetical protein
VKFSHRLTYDASPSDVRAMLGDPAFREKVCVAMEASRRDVTIVPSGAGGMSVVVEQVQPARGIPSFAKRFVGDEIHIVQRESWTDGSSADLTIDLPGKPARFAGTITLAPDGDGTVETISGDVAVKVPLVGGRLESLVGDLLQAALRAEERVGRAWLAGSR